jgi:hypothetical protein
MSISSLTFVGVLKAADDAYIAATGAPPVIQGGQKVDQTNAQLVLVFIANLTGSYVAGGDALDFTAAAPADYQLPSTAPTLCVIEEIAVIGTAGTGMTFRYAYGPVAQPWTPQGGAVQIFGGATASQDGMNEIPVGTYASTTPSLNNKQIKIVATFGKG